MKKFLVIVALSLSLFISCKKNVKSPSAETPTPVPTAITYNNLFYGKPCTTCTEIDHGAYVLCHDNAKKVPLWTAYELGPDLLTNCVERIDAFAPEPNLTAGQRAELADFVGSGYDRGHMVPANDMCRSREVMDLSFYLSNMIAQNSTLNRGRWAQIEGVIHDFALTRPIWVYTGPVFLDDNADGQPDPIETLGTDAVWVPDAVYKIVIWQEKNQIHAVAFYAVNAAPTSSVNRDYVTTIDNIESKTGLDFLNTIPDAEEVQIEGNVPTESELTILGI